MAASAIRCRESQHVVKEKLILVFHSCFSSSEKCPMMPIVKSFSSKVNQIHFIPTWTPWLLDIVPARQGFYFQHSMLIHQRWSGLPGHVPASAHDWRHVLTFQGKSGSVFGSFTTCRVSSNHVGTLARQPDAVALSRDAPPRGTRPRLPCHHCPSFTCSLSASPRCNFSAFCVEKSTFRLKRCATIYLVAATRASRPSGESAPTPTCWSRPASSIWNVWKVASSRNKAFPKVSFSSARGYFCT